MHSSTFFPLWTYFCLYNISKHERERKQACLWCSKLFNYACLMWLIVAKLLWSAFDAQYFHDKIILAFFYLSGMFVNSWMAFDRDKIEFSSLFGFHLSSRDWWMSLKYDNVSAVGDQMKILLKWTIVNYNHSPGLEDVREKISKRICGAFKILQSRIFLGTFYTDWRWSEKILAFLKLIRNLTSHICPFTFTSVNEFYSLYLT